LACRVSNVAATSPEKKIQERLLPVKIGLDTNGQPTPPLQKKLDSLGLGAIGVDQLETISDGKQDVLHISRMQAGKAFHHAVVGQVTFIAQGFAQQFSKGIAQCLQCFGWELFGEQLNQ